MAHDPRVHLVNKIICKHISAQNTLHHLDIFLLPAFGCHQNPLKRLQTYHNVVTSPVEKRRDQKVVKLREDLKPVLGLYVKSLYYYCQVWGVWLIAVKFKKLFKERRYFFRTTNTLSYWPFYRFHCLILLFRKPETVFRQYQILKTADWVDFSVQEVINCLDLIPGLAENSILALDLLIKFLFGADILTHFLLKIENSIFDPFLKGFKQGIYFRGFLGKNYGQIVVKNDFVQ